MEKGLKLMTAFTFNNQEKKEQIKPKVNFKRISDQKRKLMKRKTENIIENIKNGKADSLRY